MALDKLPAAFGRSWAAAQNRWDLLRSLLSEITVPVGTVIATARETAPTGYLLCDGAAVSRSTYRELFAAIGIKFGEGDKATTFNLPDLRGRVPVGVDGAAARLAEKDKIGEAGGTETQLLTVEQIPSHEHQEIARFSGSGVINGVALNTLNNALFGTSNSTGATGGGKAHPNMQPYQVVNYMVKT